MIKVEQNKQIHIYITQIHIYRHLYYTWSGTVLTQRRQCNIRYMNCQSHQFSSVTQLCPTLCDPMNRSTPGLPVHHQHPRVYPNSCPLSRWCHPTILSSVVTFCLQSFPALGSFPMSQFFTSGGKSIGASTSASVLPMNIQDWFPLGWTGWISLQSKGLSRVFSNTTVQKQQFFGTQHSLWSNSHIHTWLVEEPYSKPKIQIRDKTKTPINKLNWVIKNTLLG